MVDYTPRPREGALRRRRGLPELYNYQVSVFVSSIGEDISGTAIGSFPFYRIMKNTYQPNYSALFFRRHKENQSILDCQRAEKPPYISTDCHRKGEGGGWQNCCVMKMRPRDQLLSQRANYRARGARRPDRMEDHVCCPGGRWAGLASGKIPNFLLFFQPLDLFANTTVSIPYLTYWNPWHAERLVNA